MRSQAALLVVGFVALDVSTKLNNSIALTVLGVDRSSVQLPNPQLGGVGAVVDFRPNSLLTFSLGYLQRNTASEPKTTKGVGVTIHVTLGSTSTRKRTSTPVDTASDGQTQPQKRKG